MRSAARSSSSPVAVPVHPAPLALWLALGALVLTAVTQPQALASLARISLLYVLSTR